MTNQELQSLNVGIAKMCGQTYHKPTPQEIASGSYYQYEPDYTRSLDLTRAAVCGQSEGFKILFNIKMIQAKHYKKLMCFELAPLDWALAFKETAIELGLWKGEE